MLPLPLVCIVYGPDDGRNQANGIWTTYESADLTNQMMKSNYELQWKGGGEVRFGRRFCCDTWALEFGYWTSIHSKEWPWHQCPAQP